MEREKKTPGRDRVNLTLTGRVCEERMEDCL